MKRVLVGVAIALLVFAGAPAALAAPGPSDAPEWWVDRWGVHSLWAAGADGRGITIAEIDSGVNAAVPEIASKVLTGGMDFGPLGGDGRTDREVDPFGHGTAMASIMVAASGPFGIEGLAPAAKILPLAIPLAGTQDASGNDHLDEAIKYAADHGAKIVSMSLGADREQKSDALACPADEQAAIYYALSKGLVLVAAAGNNGPSGTDIEEPAVCVGVITVGAIDSTGAVASFSSRTPKLTVTAPGVNIPSLGRVPGQAYNGKGTSQAAALTSAAIALIWSKYPSLTNRQVVARLLATLDNPRTSPDPASGYGQINPASAINQNVPANAPNVVFDVADPFVAQLTAPAAVPTPAAVSTAAQPPGSYAARTPPSDVTAEVKVAGGVSVAGLLALLVLVVVGLRSWRRRRVTGVPALSWSTPAAGSAWHDVFEPPAWAAPASPPQWTAPLPDEPVPYPPASITENVPPVPPEWSPPAESTPSPVPAEVGPAEADSAEVEPAESAGAVAATEPAEPTDPADGPTKDA